MDKTFTKPQDWDLHFSAMGATRFDAMVCSGEICSSNRYDGICRDGVFVNLRIDTSSIRPVRVVHEAVKMTLNEFEVRTSGLLAHVETYVDLTYPGNYEMNVVRDYYGDEAYSSLTPYAETRLRNALNSWNGWAA